MRIPAKDIPFSWKCPYCNQNATITNESYSSKIHPINEIDFAQLLGCYQLMEAGVPAPVTRDLMGHSDIRITFQIYTPIVPAIVKPFVPAIVQQS